jgi:predicted RNA-binding protein with PUA-like domain
MKYWLIKSEPDVWSWDQQVHKGEQGEPWTGVRNYQARNFMGAMRKGDQAFFYHSNAGKKTGIVGIVEIIKEAYPDPTDPAGVFNCVDVKAVQPFRNPVFLSTLKTIPELETMLLFKQSRLSVMPVTDQEWDCVVIFSPRM